MSPSAASRQFEAQGSRLPGSGEVPGLRRAALARFEALGLPNRSNESWRYTDLSPLLSKPLDYLAASPPASILARADLAIAGLSLDAGTTRLVFVDGYCASSLSSRPSVPGLTVHLLGEQPAALLTAGRDDSALASLNQALARDGAWVRVAAAAAHRLAIVCVGSGRGQAQQLRFRLELGRGAQLTLEEYRLDLSDADESWLNTVIDLDLAEHSCLDLLRLQRHGSSQYSTSLTRARLAAGAKLVAHGVEAGGKVVRNEYEIALEGPGAGTDIAGLALTHDKQHCDTRIAVEHRAPRTTSVQNYRSIAADESRSVFNGKVTVREQAQHIDARQQNDSLLLSPRAEVDAKPELEIYADQVACSHGATVGDLSEDEIFYLRARGIDAGSARAILTRAFAAVILERFASDSFRARAAAAVAAFLPAHPAIDP